VFYNLIGNSVKIGYGSPAVSVYQICNKPLFFKKWEGAIDGMKRESEDLPKSFIIYMLIAFILYDLKTKTGSFELIIRFEAFFIAY